MAVHAGHLELVLEVGHGAQPAQDRPARPAPCTKSISSDEKPITSTFAIGASTSRAIATRSAAVKNGRFASLSATPTMTRSKSARRAAHEVLVARA